MIIVEGGVRYEVILTSKGVELIVDKPEKKIEKPEKVEKVDTPKKRPGKGGKRKKGDGTVIGFSENGKWMRIRAKSGSVYMKPNPDWKEPSDGLAKLGQVQDAEVIE